MKVNTVLKPYNHKIQSSLGDVKITDRIHRNQDGQLVAQEPWRTYFGVEFELEINAKSPKCQQLLDGLKPEEVKYLYSKDEYKNTIFAHFVASRVTPSVEKFAIAKRDGSLANGIEVVSLPMSLTAHQTYWDQFFKDVNEWGLDCTRTCGMHVHVSRELMTDLQIGKVLQWMHDPKNAKIITIIAGRCPPDKYANLKNKYTIKHARTMRERYSAFNLTNTHTVEFRIFKGVKDKQRFLVNLEFCAALISFCASCQTSLKNIDAKSFLTFVSSNASMYRNLEAFLIAKRLLKRRFKKLSASKIKKYNIDTIIFAPPRKTK